MQCKVETFTADLTTDLYVHIIELQTDFNISHRAPRPINHNSYRFNRMSTWGRKSLGAGRVMTNVY